MSNETWLHACRSEPSPQFADQLQARLRAQEPVRIDVVHTDVRRSLWPAGIDRAWLRRALVPAAAVVLCAVLLAVPGVRASVAEFVSLFRVSQVVAVPVDSRALDRLRAEHLDLETLIGQQVEVLEDPGPPLAVGSLVDAAAAANMTLALPRWLPDQTRLLEMAVKGERVVRITADARRLQQAMDALGIEDLTVPPGLDGQAVTVRVPPVVMIRYDHGKRRSRLFQARAPQLTLPNSIDVQALGEIGLRVLGFSPAEAKQFAGALDWHTTLILPVPPNATSFRQVTVGGQRGVLIQHQPPDQSPTTTIVWSTPERVFALVSILGPDEALTMANSVR
jgi:hypothetical protein